jgi:tetratricopeptide (TPR) repeat protein
MALGMMSLNGLIGYQERGRIERLLFAMLLFFLSLLAKEGAVTLLVVAPLILYYTTPGNKNWRSAGLGLWLLLPFAAWLVLRMAVMTNGLAYTPDFNDNPLVGAGFSDRMATGFVLLGSYLQLLIMPLVQSWDYSYNQIPVVSWMHPAPWAWALVHILGAVMALRWLSTKNIGGLILLAYLVSILLYSNQFILIGTMMGTRLVYAASVWFCVGLALVAHRATGRRVTESPAIAWKLFMVSLALVYGVMTFIRSATWKDAHTLFTADAEHAPRSFRTQRAAAEQYLVWYSEHRTSRDTGVWLDKAAVLYRRSLSIQPTENAWIGLGNIAYFRRLYPEAVRSFEQALELKPNNALAREQLGHCYRDWGKWEGQVKNNLPKAAELLQKSVDYHPGDADAWQALGTARGLLLQHDLAVGAFEAALKLNPGNPEILRNLAIAYQGLGDQEKFLSTLRLLKQGG